MLVFRNMYHAHGFEGQNKPKERKPTIDDRANSGAPSVDVRPGAMTYEAQNLKPAFEDFFRRVVSEKPDYLILLDKGARPFGLPFKKFLNDLQLETQPEVIFWNDSNFKHSDTTESPFPDEYLAHPELHGKKLFFVDETYARGSGARAIKNFLDASGEDGSYFAFSTAEAELNWSSGEEVPDRNLDSRFHIYENVPANGLDLFTKKVASGYVIDSNNVPSMREEPIRTVPRYAQSEDFSHKRIGNFDDPGIQEDIRDFRSRNMETKQASDKTLYEVLSSIDKTKLRTQE